MDNKRLFTTKFFNVTTVFALFLLFISVNVKATVMQDTLEKAETDTAKAAAHGEKELDISDVILHHIADSHEWHFWGEGAHKVAIPLPVILITKGGVATFLASKHEADEEGKEIFTEKGTELINYEGKYYYPGPKNADGTYFTLDENKIPVNDKPLDMSITKNVLALFISVALLLIIFGTVAKGYRKRVGKAPKGLQAVLEPFIVFVRDDIARPQLGHKYKKFLPYLLTLFFFVWINNLLGLIPIFPGGANLTGNIAVTLMLALGTFILTTVNANTSYWKHVFNTPGVPWWLKLPIPLMPVVEFIGVLARPIALMIRLFANITAGHILILALLSLIVILKAVTVSLFSIPFVIFISLIELLVGFLQAFIFTILSALFIGLAVQDDHH
ncbi:ATP synthase F0 subcomplex A subunit [Mucilaginibacter pineti]|uniref:ATP synthase subunit a n=1 Tax=Mucilaginibacter pineti TaxID=1391627 RepID=A0A1G7CYN7_9SPHI|nr:F0F1 ATP synthase subunit A [Mucilaginibacter pineti]SDE43756.1 ATP synthase F0 subcomplex A subunit [Mucilaginibacter pineti]